MFAQLLSKLNKVVTFFAIPVAIPVAILVISGDMRWLNGWVWGIQFIVLNLSTELYLYFKNPALLKERLRKPGLQNQVKKQTVLIYLMAILYGLWVVVMPLDAKRFQWTNNFPIWLEVVGAIMLVPAFFFTLKPFIDNTFLSPLVTVQSDRHQKVISTGAYAVVRHPMYLGTVLSFLGTPLFLGSNLGVLIGIILTLLLIERLLAEEKMLVEELDGYVEYQTEVKFRLIPFVW